MGELREDAGTTRSSGPRDSAPGDFSRADPTPSSPVTPAPRRRSHAVDPDTERAWVAGLRRGEPAAFDAVYGAYRARVFGYLARMTGRRDLREDPRLGAWLFTVAHNVIVSQARAARVTTALAAELARHEDAVGTTPFEALAE